MKSKQTNTIRAVIFLSALFLFHCCKSDPPQKQNSSSIQSVSKIESDTLDEPDQKGENNLILNQSNHEAFLLDYFNINSNRRIALTTRLGTIKIKLYDDTPLHTANFLMLTEREYFNNTEFTRVVEKFVVQGGNNEKEEEEIKRLLIGNYEMKAEIRENHIHRKGVIAMARRYEENPDKLSSAYNFYLVQGQRFKETQLIALERDHEMTIPDWKREIYKSVGGAPHLDGEHTVFGEIYEGLDVLDRMASVETDKSDWPLDPLIMQIEIIEE